jgi:hypothetical protein
MSDDLEPSSLGNDPEQIPDPDLSGGMEPPEQPRPITYDAMEEDEQPDPKVAALESKVTELTMKLNRLVEAHDSDFQATEQSMQIRRLQEQVTLLENRVARPYPDADNDANPMPYVWLGVDNSTNVIEQAVNSNTIVNMTSGRTVASTDVLTIGSTQGFYVEFTDFNGGSQVVRRVKIAGGSSAGTIFPVTLTQTGGSAGSKTTKCSFTYTVKDITATTTLGTGITPIQQADYNNGKRSAATYGWGYLDGSNVVHVFCFEDRTTGSC